MTMHKFKIGTDDFSELLAQGGYFVDKTPMLAEVVNGSKIVLLPRPRRFGKTLAMSMLRYFFEKSPVDRRPLFAPFAVARDAQTMAHFAQYPVIALTLKGLVSGEWEGIRHKLAERISNVYLHHQELLPSLPLFQQEIYERIMTGKASQSELEGSLKNLISHLYAYHQKPVVLLIDEYDAPMIKAWGKPHYDAVAGFMREWLGEALKHENGPALFHAVVTGILRIAKESIFSGLNNLKVYSAIAPGPYAAAFGFTEAEVTQILQDFGQTERQESMRAWYNGHLAGGQPLYNPWSVINSVMDFPEPLQPYWLNTADPAIIHELLAKGGITVRRDLETLMTGGELRAPILDTIIFRDLDTHPPAALVWTFLCYAGYLRADDPAPSRANRHVMTHRLMIPNIEVSLAYEQFVQRVYQSPATANGLDEFLACFRDDQALARLEPLLNRLMGTLVSAFDPANEPEAFYHALVLGVLAGLRDAYEIVSNGEAGYGRADLRMRPLQPDFMPLAFIIEFKVADSAADLETTAQAALAQIETKDYAAALLKAGVPAANIRKLGLAFADRRVRIAR